MLRFNCILAASLLSLTMSAQTAYAGCVTSLDNFNDGSMQDWSTYGSFSASNTGSSVEITGNSNGCTLHGIQQEFSSGDSITISYDWDSSADGDYYNNQNLTVQDADSGASLYSDYAHCGWCGDSGTSASGSYSATLTTELVGVSNVRIILGLYDCHGSNNSQTNTLDNISIETCAEDVDADGYREDEGDCDDANSSVYPGADEYCNGVDDDCDGDVDEDDAVDVSTWYADSDSDGYGDLSSTDTDCDEPSGYVADSTDCDDTDSGSNPGADEYCDGHDDDCDGDVDEDEAVDVSTWYADSDSDGYGDASSTDIDCDEPTGYVADATDCDDTDNGTYPGADEYCDSFDNDCDGDTDEDEAVDAQPWYIDYDGDGYGATAYTATSCESPEGYVTDSTDCDDANSSSYPGASEYCDSFDNDCDGEVDEDDAVDSSTWYADSDSDGYGDASSADIDCDQPSGYVADSTDCDDTDSGSYPGANEYCDGVDHDCDGESDEDDAVDVSTWYIDYDGDGYGAATYTAMSCDSPPGYVDNTDDCDDTDNSAYPGAIEHCDGRDDDCDGQVDEEDAVDVSTWYADSDGDGYGDALVTNTSCDEPSGYVADSTDCDDTDASIHVDAEESWYDGIDQNCDTDSDYDQDGDGFDHADYGGDDCNDEDEAIHIDAEESWYDGVDQDCDGESDYDSDKDGQDSESYGGEDCDDADPETYTGAPDTPYDGLVTDCANVDDYDADGDGSVALDYGGDDCDDANSDIHPEAEETWYDGVDQDCDGNDDDQDEDGWAFEDDCDDTDPESYPDNGVLDADCDPLAEDSGTSEDTGDTGTDEDEKDDLGSCGCSNSQMRPLGLGMLLLMGLVILRRRQRISSS